jgi:phosphoribosylformimino-5-aminoimidazole carboxamide ribonucleotide (ProFAR) isomerase
VTFEVIPAVDVAAGRLARYSLAGPVQVEAHGGDPVAAARKCLEAGATWIHVVDLDLAFAGASRNLDVLRAIVGLGGSVQAAGGVTDDLDVASALDAGAARVVLGSAAFADLELVATLIDRYGDALAVGIETDGDRIRARGRRTTDLPLLETLEFAAAAGASRFVVTAVQRVATLAGPDLAGVAGAVASGVPVIASGGMASIADLRAARDAGAVGAIVGRAVIEGDLDLSAAIESVA